MKAIPDMTFFLSFWAPEGLESGEAAGLQGQLPKYQCHFLRPYCAPNPFPEPGDPLENRTDPGLVGHTSWCGRRTSKNMVEHPVLNDPRRHLWKSTNMLKIPLSMTFWRD